MAQCPMRAFVNYRISLVPFKTMETAMVAVALEAAAAYSRAQHCADNKMLPDSLRRVIRVRRFAL